MNVCTLTIDGVEVVGTEGETILEIARNNNIEVPTLCHLDGLSDVASCRLCVVELAPSGKLLPACMVTVEEGMVVTANSEKLHRYRQQIIEMLENEIPSLGSAIAELLGNNLAMKQCNNLYCFKSLSLSQLSISNLLDDFDNLTAKFAGGGFNFYRVADFAS